MPVNPDDPFGWLQGSGAAPAPSHYQEPLTSGRKAGQRLIGEAVRAAARTMDEQTPAATVRDAVAGQLRWQDRTGAVSFGAAGPGSAQISPAGSNWSIGFSAGPDKSVSLSYDSGRTDPRVPGVPLSERAVGRDLPWTGAEATSGPSPARMELEDRLEEYRSRNPYWYRP